MDRALALASCRVTAAKAKAKAKAKVAEATADVLERSFTRDDYAALALLAVIACRLFLSECAYHIQSCGSVQRGSIDMPIFQWTGGHLRISLLYWAST